jgi:hypothetical protein
MAGGRVVPKSDEVIERFFTEQRGDAEGRRVERLERAEADLRACLEEHAALVLAETEVALLALERQFDATGPAARVMQADALLLLLPLYLEESQWRGLDLEDRRLRIRIAEPLAHAVARLPELQEADLGTAVWIIEATVRHAVWMLRQEREATRRH